MDIDWKDAQDNDENLQIVRDWLTEGVIPTKEEQKHFNLELRRYAQILDKLKVHESGTLYIQKYENESNELEEKRPLLPDSKVKEVLRTLHNTSFGGHRGQNSTLKKLLQCFWLPRPALAVKSFISQCLPCVRKLAHSNSPRHVHRDVMRSTREPYPDRKSVV